MRMTLPVFLAASETRPFPGLWVDCLTPFHPSISPSILPSLLCSSVPVPLSLPSFFPPSLHPSVHLSIQSMGAGMHLPIPDVRLSIPPPTHPQLCTHLARCATPPSLPPSVCPPLHSPFLVPLSPEGAFFSFLQIFFPVFSLPPWPSSPFFHFPWVSLPRSLFSPPFPAPPPPGLCCPLPAARRHRPAL